MGGIVVGLVGVAAPAYALDCQNASRPAPDITGQTCVPEDHGVCAYMETLSGNWVYIYNSYENVYKWTFLVPGTTNAGNYQDGQGFALLDNGMAPCLSNRQDSHGIQLDDPSTKCP
jgi:hypothetical protein